MTLTEWIDQQVATSPTHTTRRAVVAALCKAADVSYTTLGPADRGGRIVLYNKALDISRATGWAVSTIELCDPKPDERLAQIRAMVT